MGFPLPTGFIRKQEGNQKMKQQFIKALQGLNTDAPARRLPEHRLSAVSNVIFKDIMIKKRWGFNAMSSTQLSGAIMRIHLYETAISGTKKLLIFTENEAYLYNNETGVFGVITRNYSYGKVSAVSGTSVTGDADAQWNASWDDSYTVLKIGFGSIDPDAITTWYGVSSIGSATAITLSETGPTITTDTAYCLKFCFSGDEDDFFGVANPYDGKESDKIVAVCNGIEEIMKFTGTGYLKPIGEQIGSYDSTNFRITGIDTSGLFAGMPAYGVGAAITANTVILTVDSATQVTLTVDGTTAGGVNTTLATYPVYFGYRRPAKYLGYFGSVGFEHFLSAWITDSTNEPQRIEVGAAGKYPETFLNDVTGDYGTYYLLYDSNEEIFGMHALQNRIIVYKEQSITEMWAVPGSLNSDPYNFVQDKIRNIGPLSGETVVNYGRFHIFMGWDNFYMFDGINATPIGDEVIQGIIDSINETYAKRAFAMPIREEKLYVVFIPTGDAELPNVCYAYHYLQKTWTKWDFTDGSGGDIYFTSWGRYRKSYSPTWQSIYDLGTLWSAATMRWTDLIIYENIDRYLLGDSDGYVYEFAPEFSNDNGYGFVSSFTTKDFDMGNPKYTIKVLEAILGMRSQTSGYLRIRASADFGNTWSEWMTVAMSGTNEYIESVANVMIRGKQVRFQIDNDVSTEPDYFEFENLNIGYNDSGIVR